MLTTAVFAICITAPLGAIMINTLGTKWLEYDGDDPEILAKHGMAEPRQGFKPTTKANFVTGELPEQQKETERNLIEEEERPPVVVQATGTTDSNGLLGGADAEAGAARNRKPFESQPTGLELARVNTLGSEKQPDKQNQE